MGQKVGRKLFSQNAEKCGISIFYKKKAKPVFFRIKKHETYIDFHWGRDKNENPHHKYSNQKQSKWHRIHYRWEA